MLYFKVKHTKIQIHQRKTKLQKEKKVKVVQQQANQKLEWLHLNRFY
jgi:hypothetical protein